MSVFRRLASIGWAVDIALIASASLVIFVPSARPGLKDAVFALWMANGGLGIYTNWKAGLLTKTPRQLYESIRISGPPKGAAWRIWRSSWG